MAVSELLRSVNDNRHSRVSVSNCGVAKRCTSSDLKAAVITEGHVLEQFYFKNEGSSKVKVSATAVIQSMFLTLTYPNSQSFLNQTFPANFGKFQLLSLKNKRSKCP